MYRTVMLVKYNIIIYSCVCINHSEIRIKQEIVVLFVVIVVYLSMNGLITSCNLFTISNFSS